jgi:hypothetical protein
MTLLINSETFFLNFINSYDIILDSNYNIIKDIYNNVNKNNKHTYEPYLNLFNKYDTFKSDINFIYYIIILYYMDDKLLLNYIRFYSSKLNNFKLIKFDKLINYCELNNYNKSELIEYLKNLIDNNSDNLLFFIITFQNYL